MSKVKLAAVRYALSNILSDAAADTFARYDLLVTDVSFTPGRAETSFAKLKARNPSIKILPYLNFGEIVAVNRPAGWWQKVMDEKWLMRRAPLVFTAAPASGATTASLTTPWGGATGTYNIPFVETAGGAIQWRAATLTRASGVVGAFAALTANCNAVAAAVNTPLLSGYPSAWAIDITREDGAGKSAAEWLVETTVATYPPNIDGAFVDIYNTGLSQQSKLSVAPMLSGATGADAAAGATEIQAEAGTLGALNAYTSHYLMITSGADAGRVIYITGNDAGGPTNKFKLFAGTTLPAAIPAGSRYELYSTATTGVSSVTYAQRADLSSDGLTADGAGYDTDSAVGLRLMSAALRRALDRLRELLGPDALIMLNAGASNVRKPSHHDLSAADNIGIEFEGCVGKAYSRAWQYSVSAYRNLMRRFPQSYFGGGSVTTSWPADPELSELRFAFLSGCLVGGYIGINHIAGGYATDNPAELDEMELFRPGVSPDYVDLPPPAPHWPNGVWKREFASCLVVVNPTDASQTVDVAGLGWKRLLGTQDAVLNDGTAAGSITLAAKRAQLFVRAA